mgnify:CR=1 FL=1
MSGLTFAPLDAAAALAVAAWRYPPPYDVYNIADNPAETALFLAARGRGYYQLRDGAGELAAFCCFGEEARVPGGDYSAPALDVGLGLRPDLTGRGLGRAYLEATLAFGAARFGPGASRLTVAAFNARAIRLYTQCGFAEVARFTSAFGGRAFIIMARDA